MRGGGEEGWGEGEGEGREREAGGMSVGEEMVVMRSSTERWKGWQGMEWYAGGGWGRLTGQIDRQTD